MSMRNVSFARYSMLAAVLACTTTPKAPPVTSTPVPVRQQQNGAPQNLRVLPRTLSRDSVVHIMRFEVASGLGVQCQYCHVGRGDSMNFASDEKQTKRTAREMMRMVSRINSELLTQIPGRGTPPLSLQCITCHRGVTRPQMLEDTLARVVETFGSDSASATYQRLKTRYYGRMAYDFGQRSLNTLASRLIERGKLQDAKRMLELNIAEHPDVWDPHFELARIDESLGLKDEAIEQYRIVVRMLPQHQGAQRRLRELTGQP
jgi:hypothetical protein